MPEEIKPQPKPRKVLRLLVGTEKYELGQSGVVLIEVSPPLAGVDYENGTSLGIYSPMEPMYWYHEEAPDIVIPQIAVPGDLK